MSYTVEAAQAKKRNYEYNYQGLKDEALVTKWLQKYLVGIEPSSQHQDTREDIDLVWYHSSPPDENSEVSTISIKCEHAGERYGHTYFELMTQHYTSYNWEPEWSDLMLEAGRGKTDTFNPGWFYFGKATHYVVLQGKILSIYRKSDIQAYVAAHGWVRVSGLSQSRLASQGGKDTVCGFLNTSTLPFVYRSEIDLSSLAP